MCGFNKRETGILKKLDTPKKVQDFIDKLKINFEPCGDSCRSPRAVLKTREAHCIEAAMLAAVALRLQGRKPLLVDLSANSKDDDHVIAVFKEKNKWGAISKSNHATLRYRDPVYKSLRELVMSYFNEYYNDAGQKTLRSYSVPLNLEKFDNTGWETSETDVWEIPEALVKARHFNIVTKSQLRKLRKADKFEIKIGKIVEWKKRKMRKKPINASPEFKRAQV